MARLFSRLRRRRDQVVVFLHNIFKIERKMATPPSENAIVAKPEGDSEVSRMVINDTILRLVFETFLSRKDLLNTARVCWQWHRETMPHLNKVVDVTFSWTFHKDRVSKKGRNETGVNEDLLLRLKDQNSILSNQVREIRIIDYLPPDGIVTKRQRGSDFGAFGQLSEWAANDLILGPQGQLQQLVYVIPRLQLQGLRGVAWLGYPSAPDSFISMMSLHPSLDFKIGFGTARLPRERTESRQILIKFLTNIHATRVQNLTTFEYDIPAEPEGYSSMGMLGEVIRASPNLQTLSLFALPHPDSNQRTCPWAIDDGPVNKPFPTVKKLKLIGFGLDALSATDRQAWKNLIQWDKLNSFTTDHKPFFNLHSTPNLKRLALLSPCGHVSSLPGEDDATRQALTGHTPLTHLVLYDEKLLSREVWNHHKQTLVSLTLHKTHSRLFINDLMFLPRLQHLAIDVTEGEQEWYDSSTMNHTKATTLWPKTGPTFDTAAENFIHIQHLKLTFLTTPPPMNFCRDIWTYIWRNLVHHGRMFEGPDWFPRLRQLDLDIFHQSDEIPDKRTRYRATLSSLSNDPAKMGQCDLVNLDVEYLANFHRKYHKDVPQGDDNLDELMGFWKSCTVRQLLDL